MLNRSTTWAVVLLVATFGAGVVVGVGGRAMWARYAEAAAPERRRGPDRLVTELDHLLRLTPAQRNTIHTILQRHGARLSNVRAAFGAFLPTLTAGGSSNLASANRYNSLTGQIVTVPSNTSYSGSLTLSLNLFDGFRRLAGRSAASATLDAADAEVVNQRAQVTAATQQLFFTALANEELVR